MDKGSSEAIRAKLEFLRGFILLVTIPNMFLFFISALICEGEALGGKVENGKYFLRTVVDKHFEEVSKELWLYSYVQGLSLVAGILAILSLSLILKYSKKR